MDLHGLKIVLKRVWHFIWEDESWASWIVNVILAFVLIKFIIYPALGFAFGTRFPIVAVISGSMEHDGSFDSWWSQQAPWYGENNITQDDFRGFPFRNGFNKGDIMVLVGVKPGKVERGQVIVFQSSIRPDPIIHRVVHIREGAGGYRFQTKGDHNGQSYPFEQDIPQEVLLGKAVFRVPFLGYIKIWFVELLRLLHVVP